MPDENPFLCLSETAWVSAGPTNIGIVNFGADVYLIDSGNDKDAGRRLLKALRAKGWKLKAVINTHSNADHIGANAYLQNSTGCEIWAPEVEACFTENPLLEPSFLWGAYPFKELRSKFFEAKACRVNRLINADTQLQGLQFIPLPGHFFNQYGILTDDGVFYLADSLFGEPVLKKYGLPFIYDVEAFRGSIENIKGIDAEYYVPSHGNIVKDISETADLNLSVLSEAEEDILRLLDGGLIFEELLKEFCDLRGIALNPGQYVLVGSTLKSILSYLCNNSKAGYTFKENRMYWKAL
ncbi:MAG: MBL fold metallo-hydrolase [Spirochaetales bacterium]|nr:MBL fold metallo-hydrolase [Spirochaetales bacterium]